MSKLLTSDHIHMSKIEKLRIFDLSVPARYKKLASGLPICCVGGLYEKANYINRIITFGRL